MAQDVLPETVFEPDRPDILAQQYLRSGGRVVWIGDIPFYYRGKRRIAPVNVEIPHGEVEQVGFEGQLSVLGSLSSIAISKGQVNITGKGKKNGLKTQWTGERPVQQRLLGRGSTVLARTSILPMVRVEDVYPQRGKGDGHQTWSSRIIEGSGMLEAVTSIVSALLIVAGLGLWLIDAGDEQLTWRQISMAIALSVAVGAIALNGFRKWLGGRFASAWVKKYGEKGEFIRIWDRRNPEMNAALLSELMEISISHR